jgi:hypothetical protein
VSLEDFSLEEYRQSQTEIALLRSRISALDCHTQDAEKACRECWDAAHRWGWDDALCAAINAVGAVWKAWCPDPTICADCDPVCQELRKAIAAIDALDTTDE